MAVKFDIKDDSSTIVFFTSQGELSLPLDVKIGVLRRMRAAGRAEDSDDLDVFLALLDGLEDDDSLRRWDQLGTMEATRIVDEYFQQFTQRAGGDSGEYGSSSEPVRG